MSFLDKHLRQSATYWKRTGVDNSGDPSFDTPKAVKVRWEERTAVFTNAAGEEAQAGAIVFVKEDMNSGDFLILGTSTTADPTEVSGSREVQGFSKIPHLINLSLFERIAFLAARSR